MLDLDRRVYWSAAVHTQTNFLRFDVCRLVYVLAAVSFVADKNTYK